MKNFEKEIDRFHKSDIYKLTDQLGKIIFSKIDTIINFSTLNICVSKKELYKEIQNRIEEKSQTMSTYDLYEILQLCKWCGEDNVEWELYIFAEIYKSVFTDIIGKKDNEGDKL